MILFNSPEIIGIRFKESGSMKRHGIVAVTMLISGRMQRREELFKRGNRKIPFLLELNERCRILENKEE